MPERLNRHTRVVTRLVQALLVCSSLTSVATISEPAQAANNSTYIASFYQHDYNNCDARILSHYYGLGMADAKAKAGQKMLGSTHNAFEQQLAAARRTWKCEYGDTGFSNNDAVALSRYWGTNTGTAKYKVVRFFSEGNGSVAWTALHAARP